MMQPTDPATAVPRDEKFLHRLLAEMPGRSIARADPAVSIRKALYLSGRWNVVDVECITDIGVSVGHPLSAPCSAGNGCTDECRPVGVYVSFRTPDVEDTNWVQVDQPEVIPLLISRLKNAIETGSDTVISPENLALTIATEYGLTREQERKPPLHLTTVRKADEGQVNSEISGGLPQVVEESFEVTVSPRIASSKADASYPGVSEYITHFLIQAEQLAGLRIDGTTLSADSRLAVDKGPGVVISATVRPHTRSGIIEGQALATMLASHRNPLVEELRPTVGEIERTAERYFDRLFATAGHRLRVSVRYAP